MPRKKWDIPQRQATDEDVYFNRRKFIRRASLGNHRPACRMYPRKAPQSSNARRSNKISQSHAHRANPAFRVVSGSHKRCFFHARPAAHRRSSSSPVQQLL